MTSSNVNLLVDVNNFVFSFRHTKFGKEKKAREKYVVETLVMASISSILSYAKEFKATGLVLCSDSPKPWRRDVFPEYKANNTAKYDDPYFEDVIKACNTVAEFFMTHSAAMVLKVPKTETDDIIAVWCQESDSTNIILSSDRDYEQLVNDRTKLYSPIQKIWREPEDPSYALFLKGIRGDKSDNIRSAFPRVRESRLKKAWTDSLEMLNLLETVLPDGEKVGDLLDRNLRLIDMNEIPDNIREGILDAIDGYQAGVYSELRAVRFLSEVGIDNASGALRYKDSVLKRKPVFKSNK